MIPRSLSFRTRILLVVLALGVVPLATVGLWLAGSAARSGEALLRSRLEGSLNLVAAQAGTRWIRYRSDLLFLAEDPDVQLALQGTDPESTGETPKSLRELFDDLDPGIGRAVVRGIDGRVLWTLERPTEGSMLRVDLPIHRHFSGERLGTLEVHVSVASLLGPAGTPRVVGMVLAVSDRERGTPLLAPPFDLRFLEEARFRWGNDEWLAAERLTAEPGLRLVAAAPLSPVAGPFEAAAERGAWWLAAVALCGALAAVLVTRRLTRTLDQLAAAAAGVAGGDLEARVDEPGEDEVGQVAQAFNTMTTNLRRTLAELASRERLAAVGELAASLAHEVRNPLTAIRIDLQRVEEALATDSPLREIQKRALREIERLDATVGQTLDMARGKPAVVALRQPLDAAADAAEPAFRQRQATLERPAAEGVLVAGDPAQLEQLFLNLLLNAAAVLGPKGRAWVEVAAQEGEVVVHVHDTGTGIPEEIMERVFEPLYSTRPDGTGLGLTVARRIAEAHGGRIEIESEAGKGTTVRVHLPAREGESG